MKSKEHLCYLGFGYAMHYFKMGRRKPVGDQEDLIIAVPIGLAKVK